MRELMRLVIEQLQQLRPDVAMEAVGSAQLRLRSRPPVVLTVELQALQRACLADVEHTTSHIMKFVGQVVEQLLIMEAPPSLRREQVIPLLRTAEQVKELRAASRGAEQDPSQLLHVPAHAGPVGLSVVYGVLLGTQTQIVTRALMQELEIADEDALRAAALENLVRASEPCERVPLEAAPSVDTLLTPVHPSSLVLLEDLWTAGRWSKPHVAIPARDVLLLVEDPSPAVLAQLRQLASTIARKAPVPLLVTPLQRTSQGWSLVQN